MVKKRQGNSFEDRPKFRMAFVAGFRDRVLIPLENIGKGGTSLAGGNKISSSPPPPASSQRAVHVCLFLFSLSLSLFRFDSPHVAAGFRWYGSKWAPRKKVAGRGESVDLAASSQRESTSCSGLGSTLPMARRKEVLSY